MKKYIAVLSIFISAVILISCSSSSKLLSAEGKSVPPDFGKEKNTLLVRKTGNFQVDNELEKSFAGNYTGYYVLVDEAELERRPYNDKEKFRYIFETIVQGTAGHFTTMQKSNGAAERAAPSANYSYGVTDRDNLKLYRISFYSNGYKGLMDAYIKKLEAARLTNEKK